MESNYLPHNGTLRTNTNSHKREKTIYLTFLDVTKAYDKAWLDAIMYILDTIQIDFS